MNLNWNDTHGWDNIDIRYNTSKGNGRITRNIKDFNNSKMTVPAALSKVSQYLEQENPSQGYEDEVVRLDNIEESRINILDAFSRVGRYLGQEKTEEER